MRRSASHFFKKVWLLFDFHQPGFRHLDCIDLVLENKSLLLISWDTVHATKICIRQSRVVYRQSSGAVVCSLPGNIGSVDIVLSNIWRSTTLSIRLKYITIDQETLRHFDKYFITTSAFPINITDMQPGLSTGCIQLVKTYPSILLHPKTAVFDISINQSQFNDYVP